MAGKGFGEKGHGSEVRNIAKHELGHALGLFHTLNKKDLMYKAEDGIEKVFMQKNMPISECDIKGIKAIYSDRKIPRFILCD